MQLCDVRDLIAELNIAEDENCYMSTLPDKPECAIGCYKLNRNTGSSIGIGQKKSYGVYAISLLVHWNRYPRQSERIATHLYDTLQELKDKEVNSKLVKFIRLLNDSPVDVGKDDNGICEYVMEAEIYYERSNE